MRDWLYAHYTLFLLLCLIHSLQFSALFCALGNERLQILSPGHSCLSTSSKNLEGKKREHTMYLSHSHYYLLTFVRVKQVR